MTLVTEGATDRAGQATTDLAGPGAPVDLAITDPVAPVDRAFPDRTDRVDLVATDLADRATTDLATTDPADRATTDPADRATTDLVGPDSMGRADLADRGTAMTTVATFAALRGETGPHPGVQENRRDRRGTGRFRRPVGDGTTGRSTTGATRKPRSGIRSSTSSASTSSEFGSRCKESFLQTPASPIGEAGVARSVIV